MNILHLTLKRKWFDMIASGEKREEYREYKPYWIKRLQFGKYNAVQFRNGYRADSPVILVKLLGMRIGQGNLAWGAPVDSRVFILVLGANITGGDGVK